MCGICGFAGFRDDELLKRMMKVLAHRGPDDSGSYIDENVSLGHQRLSIIDLKTGQQPIHNEDKNLWIVFNGEIYNYLELREELIRKGHHFYTQTDTEVIIHAYEEYGKDCVKHFNGEFAFAIWDKNQKELFLARDRLGIRHLYFLFQNGRFLFASEIKALLEYEKFSPEINYQAIDVYLTLRFIPRELSLFKGVEKLEPATTLSLKDGKIRREKYWEIELKRDIFKREEDYIEGFYELLEDSVRLRLRSDVPLGAHLSGGVDSSSIAYLAKQLSNQQLKTFVIAFGTDIDETEQARQMASFLGTEHYELFLTPADFDLLPKIIWHFDEPLGDPIIIPLYLLAKATREKVKVVLTGEGADEILAGYVHQLTLYYTQLYRQIVPSFVNNLLVKSFIKFTPVSLLDRFFPYPASLGIKGREKLVSFLSSTDNLGRSYLSLASLFDESDKKELYTENFIQLVGQAYPLEEEINQWFAEKSEFNFLDRLLLFDLSRWLADNQNFKQDRVTMANALEARVPYLDHRLVEYCFTLPPKLKISRFENKILLRKTFTKRLPESVAWRKKQAFFIPVEKCFKKGFDDFVRSILSPDIVKKRGYFNYDYIEKILKGFEGSALIYNKQLMALVNLELWHQIFIDNKLLF